jgi:long-chain-alcohol oxidase
MRLSDRQRRALEDICETFCPEQDGLPTPRELGVVEAVLAAADATRAAEQKQLAALLSAWDSPIMGAIGGGGPKRFSAMTREQREQVLRSWGESSLPQRRAVFQALRKAALLFYYIVPGRTGGRNPVWDAIGYDGPLGRLPDASRKALAPAVIDRDTTLDCDVVIVGSGAGGGAAAGVLAGAGLEVIVLESGGYFDDEDFDGSEFKALTQYYMGAPSATHDQSVGLIAGACVGGGTVVNYSTSFRTPDEVREEWAQHGVPAFISEDYSASLDAVCERLGVNQEHNEPSSRERKLQEGCVKLGWHVDAMPRNVRDCAQGRESGYCALGCRLGA